MGNKYSTVANVLAEIPGSVPSELDSDKVTQYIEDASRYVDARLPNYAGFPDIGGSPATPPVIEKISRLIAAHDCLVFIGELRGENSSGSELRDISERMIEHLFSTTTSDPRAMLDPDEYDYSTTPPREEARLLDKSRPGNFYNTTIHRQDYPSEDIEDI